MPFTGYKVFTTRYETSRRSFCLSPSFSPTFYSDVVCTTSGPGITISLSDTIWCVTVSLPCDDISATCALRTYYRGSVGGPWCDTEVTSPFLGSNPNSATRVTSTTSGLETASS